MQLAEGNGNYLPSIGPCLHRKCLINSVDAVSSCAVVMFTLSEAQTLFLVADVHSVLANVPSSIDD